MPVVQTLYPTKSAIIVVWAITEKLALLEANIQLSETDAQKYSSFPVEKRKKEWLITRIMLQQLMGSSAQILYDENRNPYLNSSNNNISISHCQNYVSLFLSQSKYMGIDIEMPHKRILNIAPKFLSPKELANIPTQNPIPKLTICWCIKEAMYKYYSQKRVDFKTDLQIDPFNLSPIGLAWASIVKNDFNKLLEVNYLNQSNYCLAFVSGD